MVPRHRAAALARARAWGPAVAAAMGVLAIAAGIYVLTGARAADADPISTTLAVDRQADQDPGGATTPQPSQPSLEDPVVVPPASVAFPSAELTADIVPVGVLPSGALDLPLDPDTVGWWAAGALPGQRSGSIVLAGHVDSASQGAGALAVLLDLAAHDQVAVTGTDGSVTDYRVMERASTPKSELDPALFTREGPHRLVLITCGGAFDEATGRYADNVVVMARAASS